MSEERITPAVDVRSSLGFSSSQLQIDPDTGFKVYIPPNVLPQLYGRVNENDWRIVMIRQMFGFTPAKKLIWLKTYRETFPNKAKACKAAGISIWSLRNHLRVDEKFNFEFEEIMREKREETISRFDRFGEQDRNFMDRMAVARVMFPDDFDPARRLIIQDERRTNPDDSKRRLGEVADVVDAEVVQAQFDPNELEKRKAGNQEQTTENTQ